MGSKSNYLEAKTLDHVLGGGDYTRPATVYLAVFTTDPTDAASGTEATGSGYARLAITNNATNFPAASGTSPTQKSNGAVFTMATATGDWSSLANMTHWALFDASSGGNMLYHGSITVPKPVYNGDAMFFPIGTLVFQED